jgi:hypothetical protein
MSDSTEFPLDDLDQLFETANDLNLIPGHCAGILEKIEKCSNKGKHFMLFTYSVTSGVNTGKLTYQRLYLTKAAMPHAKKAVLMLTPSAINLSHFLANADGVVGRAVELEIRVEGGYANASLLRTIAFTKSAA